MSPIEIAANLLTLASVLLTVHLRKSQYPVGMAATVLFFLVFWKARLYASCGLQVYFTVVQIYGWWFWSKGAQGHEPQIGDWSWLTVGLFGLAAGVFTLCVSWPLYRFTNARMPLADTGILALSVLAQFLLDRKQMKSWAVWGVVNLLSIYVYANQHLWLTTGLYVLLLANVFYGWSVWRRAANRQAAGAVP